MAQDVPRDRPLTSQEREYLHSRGQHQRVEAQDAAYGVEEEDAEATDNYDDTSAWKVDDLRDELKRRELDTTGKRAELIERLRADDAAGEPE